MGRSVAQTSAFAIASMPSGGTKIRWSAERAPIAAATCEPPLAPSSSAWMRGLRPARSPALRIRRDSPGVKTPVSQNTSHHPARLLGSDSRDHLFDHDPDVLVAAWPVLDRDLVRAHEGRHDADRVLAVQPRDGPQHLELGLQLETVPALDFARRRAAGEHLVKAGPCLVDQRFLGRGARGRDRGDDPASFARDLCVGGAGEPPPQLFAPVARKRRVRVGIDEAGHDRVRRRVHDPRAVERGNLRIERPRQVRQRRCGRRATRARRCR